MDDYRNKLVSVIEEFDFDIDLQNSLMFTISPDNEVERFRKMIMLLCRVRAESKIRSLHLQNKICNI